MAGRCTTGSKYDDGASRLSDEQFAGSRSEYDEQGELHELEQHGIGEEADAESNGYERVWASGGQCLGAQAGRSDACYASTSQWFDGLVGKDQFNGLNRMCSFFLYHVYNACRDSMFRSN